MLVVITTLLAHTGQNQNKEHNMAQNSQIQISAALLEELVLSAEALTGFIVKDSQEAKVALGRLGRATAPAITLLRGASGPGSFSGDEVGQYRLDPGQSQYL